ncbi:lipoprotein [Streptomyces fumigatiscleroticus]|nr:lipoprotein [Streptomyces fumigatiscleroticus]
MTTLQSAVRRRRAVAAAGAVSAGLLVLSACDKPTPLSTITVGSDSVSAEATCGGEGKALKTSGLAGCLKSDKSISVDPDETVRFGVDPEIADKGWTILMNGQPLTDSSTKTYRTIPGSVFFNAQYGASGDSTWVSIKEGEQDVTGLWSFKLKKDS